MSDEENKHIPVGKERMFIVAYQLLFVYECVFKCVFMCVTSYQNLLQCSYDDVVLRNGLNLGSYEKWMIVNRFEQQNAGTYTCRPIPPQNVQSPPLTLAMGREWSSDHGLITSFSIYRIYACK